MPLRSSPRLDSCMTGYAEETTLRTVCITTDNAILGGHLRSRTVVRVITASRYSAPQSMLLTPLGTPHASIGEVGFRHFDGRYTLWSILIQLMLFAGACIMPNSRSSRTEVILQEFHQHFSVERRSCVPCSFKTKCSATWIIPLIDWRAVQMSIAAWLRTVSALWT